MICCSSHLDHLPLRNKNSQTEFACRCHYGSEESLSFMCPWRKLCRRTVVTHRSSSNTAPLGYTQFTPRDKCSNHTVLTGLKPGLCTDLPDLGGTWFDFGLKKKTAKNNSFIHTCCQIHMLIWPDNRRCLILLSAFTAKTLVDDSSAKLLQHRKAELQERQNTFRSHKYNKTMKNSFLFHHCDLKLVCVCQVGNVGHGDS